MVEKRLTEADVLRMVEEESAAGQRRVRALLYEQGRPDLVQMLDAKLREIHLGLDRAKSIWHSISIAQRRTLVLMGEGRHLVRKSRSRTYYNAIGGPEDIMEVARLPTVRNLAARNLVAWDGGALDPEARVVLTEHGRFVLDRGQPDPTRREVE